ncbi:hypothetical protein B0A48_01879 [Cryoendolithus antarcticus]|uniref:Uncharacterized protein n=1 Tax=Cryoendolithus antarcticus TaxID=1507870 RepID=A0A1V8TQJ6_9PEZI|nr:hypothetical protein B0A48_01879 [Cryoendolithus antarcticus]
MSIFTPYRSEPGITNDQPQVTPEKSRTLPREFFGGFGGSNTWDFDTLTTESTKTQTPSGLATHLGNPATESGTAVTSRKRGSPTLEQGRGSFGSKTMKLNDKTSKPTNIIDIVISDDDDDHHAPAVKHNPSNIARSSRAPPASHRKVAPPAYRATTPIKPKYFGHAHDTLSNTPPRTHGVFASVLGTPKPAAPMSSLPPTLGGRLNLGKAAGAVLQATPAPVAKIPETTAKLKTEGRGPFMQIDHSDDEDMDVQMNSTLETAPSMADREKETAAETTIAKALEDSRLMREAAKRRTRRGAREARREPTVVPSIETPASRSSLVRDDHKRYDETSRISKHEFSSNNSKPSALNEEIARRALIASKTKDYDTKNSRVDGHVYRATTEAPKNSAAAHERARTVKPTDKPIPKPTAKSGPSILQKIKAEVQKDHRLLDHRPRATSTYPRISNTEASLYRGTTTLRQPAPSRSKPAHHTPAPQPSIFGPVADQSVAEESEAWAARDEAMRPFGVPARSMTGIFTEDAKPQLAPVPSIESLTVPRSGPISMNSAAGVAIIRSGTAAPAMAGHPRSERDFVPSREQRAPNDIIWFSKRFKKGNNTTSGIQGWDRARNRYNIVPEDLRIAKWKEDGETWPSIIALSRAHTGQVRSEEVLRRIWLRVLLLIKPEEITLELLEEVLSGSASALQELRIRIDATRDDTTPLLKVKEAERLPKKFTLPKALRFEPIAAADLMLCQWRVDGLSWAEIIDAYNTQTGLEKTHSMVSKRWKFVEDALSGDDISVELCKRGMEGDEDALAEINHLFAEKLRERNGVPRTARGRTQEPGSRPTFRIVHTKPDLARGAPTPPVSPHSQTVVGSPRSDDVQHQTRTTRQTEAGKTINTQAAQYYAEIYGANLVRDMAGERAARSPSPITVKDGCHNAYQVERRYSLAAGIDDPDEEPQFEQWVAAGEPFETRQAAEARIWEVMPSLSNSEDESFVSTETAQLSRGRDKNRMLFVTSATETGIVQMRVRRYMRTCHDRITPASKEGWLPTQIYYVWFYTTTIISSDEDSELFGGELQTVEKELLDDAAYSDLSLANDRAMDAWVDEFVKRLANLDQWQIEKNQAKQQLKWAVEEKREDAMFDMEAVVEIAGGRKIIRVWVKEGKLEGPRN